MIIYRTKKSLYCLKMFKYQVKKSAFSKKLLKSVKKSVFCQARTQKNIWQCFYDFLQGQKKKLLSSQNVKISSRKFSVQSDETFSNQLKCQCSERKEPTKICL